MKRWQSWVWITLVLALSAFVVLRAARKGEGRGNDKTHGALERNYEFAQRVLEGSDPYREPQLHAPYPPSYGLIMAPLRLLPLRAARVAWAVLQLLCLGALVLLLRRWHSTLPGDSGATLSRAPPAWVTVLALVLVARFLSRDTSGGGGNLVWGTLVFVAVLRPLEAPGTDERPWLGTWLGIVLAAKPTPVLFLPWLILLGRYKTLAVALGVAAALHAAPLLTLGLEGYENAYRTWLTGVVAYAQQDDVFAAPSHGFPPFSWMHQSLRFALGRFLGSVPQEHVLESPLFFQGLGMDVVHIALLRRVLEATIAVLALAALWRVRRARSPWVAIHAIGLLASATLLLSPIVWKSYHLWQLPFFYGLLAGLRDEGLTQGQRREVIVGLSLYFALCGLASEALLGDNGRDVMQSFYVVTAGAVWTYTLALRRLIAHRA